jgi:diguanylate cyclase (GGDEF)-like protein
MLHGVTRLFEELGELAEAIRLEHVFPVAIRTELADVFAWIIALANSLPYLTGDPQFSFEHALWARYPGKCVYCFKEQCTCLNVRVRPSLMASAGAELDVTEDPLTGLHRKESFERDLADAVANATDREPLSLLLVDLDHFKNVNDSFGHGFGDQVLGDVATIFRKVLASYGGTGYRWGGEEFAGLLPNRSEEEAKACAERVRNELAGTPITTPKSGRHQQTVSIGVVTFQGALGTAVPVLTRALFETVDKAVYDAKQAGRNQTVVGNLAQI